MKEADVVAIGAHPDDADLTSGGTLAKLAARGLRVTVVDLTRGEAATRGTPETRRAEALAAAEVLGLQERVALDLGDGRLRNSEENRRAVIEILRELRPALVLAHHWNDLHPDHCRAGELVRDTMYPAGMPRFPAGGRAHRPNEVLFFMAHFPFEPSFVVDVSETFAAKLEAARCFRSQLADPASSDPETGISQPDFLDRLEARARFYGSAIHKTYGEPFFVRRPVPVDDPFALYRPFPKL